MIDGGFHYPQDWGYKVQNFSSIRYTRELSAGEEATFMYPFMAAELAGGRSYGLQLNLHYSANQCKFFKPLRFTEFSIFRIRFTELFDISNFIYRIFNISNSIDRIFRYLEFSKIIF